jgi:predicted nucleic acid-binding protein
VICYFDTSALVKLWLLEPDTGVVDDLWRAATIRCTTILAYAECRAALAAAARERRLTRDGARRARSIFERHWDELSTIPVDERVVRAAGDLAECQRLRGFDAVHLASAVEAAVGGTLTFATWDAPLRHAAQTLGLATPA